jgi:hypothetical protein
MKLATKDDLSAHILELHSLIGRYAVHEAKMVADGHRKSGDYTLEFFREWLEEEDDAKD